MQPKSPITPELVLRLRDTATRRDAFDQLADAMLRPLYGYARRLLVSHDDAEDAVQETFIHAYDRIDSFKGGCDELAAWLYRITTNSSLSLLRRRKRSIFDSVDAVSRQLAAEVATQSDTDADQLLVRLQEEVLRLPCKQRLIFNLRYYDEMPYAQIARVADTSESAAKTNYHYAVERLKEKMKGEI